MYITEKTSFNILRSLQMVDCQWFTEDHVINEVVYDGQ